MATLYDDPQRTATTKCALHALVQGRRLVEDYIVEFRKWSADTGWNDAALTYHIGNLGEWDFNSATWKTTIFIKRIFYYIVEKSVKIKFQCLFL